MSSATCLIDETTQYAKKIVSRKIKACKEVINACQRHLTDLKKAKDEDYPYYFSTEKANRVFKFFGFLKHVKGQYAGEYIELDDFQKFIVGSIFGWIKKENDLRRFTKAYVQLGRKNGKSLILSGIGLYMTGFDNEFGAEVYATATKREQAKIVFDDARIMGESSKDLAKRLKITRDLIYSKKMNGKFVALSKDSKSFDGFNPHLAILDEYHAHRTDEIYNVMVSGMGQRTQPLLFIITTAGFDLDSACYKEAQYCKQVVNGVVENDNYFIYIAQLDEGDDFTNPDNWIKPNPLLSKTQAGMDYLKQELKMALELPEKMRNFLTKNLNIWVKHKENGYMDMQRYEKNIVTTIPNLVGKKCYVGLDLSSKIDITSVGIVIPLENNKFFVKQHSFIPEDMIREKEMRDKVPYSLWIEQGFMTSTTGNVVDYNFVEKYIEEIAKIYDIQEIDFDPWNATQITNNLQDKGFVCVEIRQGYGTLSEPLKNFREEVYKSNIIYENDPLLKWAFSNAVVKMDSNENIMVDKSKSINRIDPAVSIINGYSRAMYDAHANVNLNKYVTDEFFEKYWS